jgi:hypothetical protein
VLYRTQADRLPIRARFNVIPAIDRVAMSRAKKMLLANNLILATTSEDEREKANARAVLLALGVVLHVDDVSTSSMACGKVTGTAR